MTICKKLQGLVITPDQIRTYFLGYHFLCKLTYNNIVVRVPADDLFDLLSSFLSGWQSAVGVTVGVVQVQNVYGCVGP